MKYSWRSERNGGNHLTFRPLIEGPWGLDNTQVHFISILESKTAKLNNQEEERNQKKKKPLRN